VEEEHLLQEAVVVPCYLVAEVVHVQFQAKLDQEAEEVENNFPLQMAEEERRWHDLFLDLQLQEAKEEVEHHQARIQRQQQDRKSLFSFLRSQDPSFELLHFGRSPSIRAGYFSPRIPNSGRIRCDSDA
jgi:hypothetical protein